jgi:hypothetical protein
MPKIFFVTFDKIFADVEKYLPHVYGWMNIDELFE